MNVSRLLTVMTAAMVWLVHLAGNPVVAGDTLGLQEQLHDANQHYVEGSYDEAVAAYTRLIGQYGLSPELLHNLGNSYAGDERYGSAVLHYLRGLRIDPGNDALEADLAKIREEIGLFDEPLPLHKRVVTLYDMNQWLTGALVSYALLTLVLALRLRFTGSKAIVPLSLLLTAIICVCCVAAYQRHHNWNGAVIVEPDTHLLLSPFASASSTGKLLPGTVVYSQKKHDGYNYVRDTRGRSGWIPAPSLAPINTSSLTYSRGSAEQ